MKKIISYSLWGDKPTYIKGAVENVKLAKDYFPGWICRFYVDKSVPVDTTDELIDLGAEVIYIPDSEQKLDGYSTSGINPGWFWRFKVLNDTSIDRFIVRDADSRLGLREKNCVLDWEKSGRKFHIIRDNPMHGVKILAGTWGATREFIDEIDYNQLVLDFESKNNTNNPVYGGYDQFFLSTVVYPLIKNDVCIHDSHPRLRYPDEQSMIRIFPAININYPANDFVGKPIHL